MIFSKLAARWREHADWLRTWAAAEGAATALERAAAELDEAVREASEERLTLEQGSAESGYSKRRLRELVSKGSIPNAGVKGAPRIRRSDLPRKPRPSGTGGYDVDVDADRLVGRMAP